MTLAQFAAVLATPVMTGRGIASIGGLGVEAIVCRAVQATAPAARSAVGHTLPRGPGFSRAIAGVLIRIAVGRYCSRGAW